MQWQPPCASKQLTGARTSLLVPTTTIGMPRLVVRVPGRSGAACMHTKGECKRAPHKPVCCKLGPGTIRTLPSAAPPVVSASGVVSLLARRIGLRLAAARVATCSQSNTGSQATPCVSKCGGGGFATPKPGHTCLFGGVAVSLKPPLQPVLHVRPLRSQHGSSLCLQCLL